MNLANGIKIYYIIVEINKTTTSKKANIPK